MGLYVIDAPERVAGKEDREQSWARYPPRIRAAGTIAFAMLSAVALAPILVLRHRTTIDSKIRQRTIGSSSSS